MKIKLCKKFSKTSKLEKKLNKAFPSAAINVKSCIGMCKRCKSQPVARIDGVKMRGKSIRKMVEKIETL